MVRPGRLYLYGRPVVVEFRVLGTARRVRVYLEMLRPGGKRPLKRLDLGPRRTGIRHTYRLTTRQSGGIGEGRLALRLHARDGRGTPLRRAPGQSATRALVVLGHRFPLLGSYSYGAAGGRFGATRPNRTHRGQDVAAPVGTPVVAPRGGTIEQVAYQATGAGHYIVLDGAGENRHYVFMHLQTGSLRVHVGQRVMTGERLGSVGNTGRSFGAHLHFEIWVGGWLGSGRAIDPLGHLRRWASGG